MRGRMEPAEVRWIGKLRTELLVLAGEAQATIIWYHALFALAMFA